MSAAKEVLKAFNRRVVLEIGTDTSGNYGHSGIPGHLGGSGPGSGGSGEKEKGKGKKPIPVDNLDLASLGNADRMTKIKERFPDLSTIEALKLSAKIREQATGTIGEGPKGNRIMGPPDTKSGQAFQTGSHRKMWKKKKQ